MKTLGSNSHFSSFQARGNMLYVHCTLCTEHCTVYNAALYHQCRALLKSTNARIRVDIVEQACTLGGSM